MNLSSILTPERTLCGFRGNSKKNVLEQISKIASTKISSSDEKSLLNSLMTREKLSSTGIGNGIAIPHGRIDNSEQPIAVLVTTESSIAFNAIDDKKVDIFFALFVPEDHCQQHLETLASIARLLSDKDFSKQVRRCETSTQLYSLIERNT